MSVFETTFLFLRHPHGGVEDLDLMKAAGFQGVFCNIGDPGTEPAEWEQIVRPRALAQGMFCGPWVRTAFGGFSWGRLAALVAVADAWQAPFVVNAEKELDGTGSTITTQLKQQLAGRDWALSMEPWPFASVDWTPLADVPVLPQLFGPQPEAPNAPVDVDTVKPAWHSYGIRCVFPTFATYGGRKPSDYRLVAPYSLYTGDDCGQNYAAWTPTSAGYEGCLETEPPPGRELIGPQHGIDAAIDRLVKLDPAGSRPNRDPDNLGTWGAYDKLRRTLKLLATEHDQR